MNVLTHSRITATTECLPARHHAQITDPEELARCIEVGTRADTATLLVENVDTGELAAYAVIGRDEGGMVTIYAARSWLTGLGAMALKGLFGAAQVINAPLRVHTDKLRTYARAIGADTALDAIDADGVPMGVFHGQ